MICSLLFPKFLSKCGIAWKKKLLPRFQHHCGKHTSINWPLSYMNFKICQIFHGEFHFLTNLNLIERLQSMYKGMSMFLHDRDLQYIYSRKTKNLWLIKNLPNSLPGRTLQSGLSREMVFSSTRRPLLRVLRNCASSSFKTSITIWGSFMISGNASP